ncbi:hypothetical protein ES288_A11G096400v1 [Gossypium darwinii]|uniref:Uncharacterized protein n=1 Tax=Gossypium darwinii TaxID=34276 RepID=A0A5D2EJF6_GOSDA|nr:hypothetical protein ES288_A11G096400v1 [Gossypium darwinii]
MTRPKNDALKMHLTLLEFDFSVKAKSKRHLVKSRIVFFFLQNWFKMHLILEFGGGLELYV